MQEEEKKSNQNWKEQHDHCVDGFLRNGQLLLLRFYHSQDAEDQSKQCENHITGRRSPSTRYQGESTAKSAARPGNVLHITQEGVPSAIEPSCGKPDQIIPNAHTPSFRHRLAGLFRNAYLYLFASLK